MDEFNKMLNALIEEYGEKDDIYDIDEFESFSAIQTVDYKRYKEAYDDYKGE